MTTTSYLDTQQQQTFSAINLASQKKTTELFFSSQVIKETIQTFSGSI